MFNTIRKKYFPVVVADGIEARPVDQKTFDGFKKRYTHLIMPARRKTTLLPWHDVPKGRARKMDPLWINYRKLHHEFILFYDVTKKNETPIGWFCGEMEDKITFYMRNSGLLPRYRQHKIYSTFLKQLLSYLRELGYEKVSSHHHPNNFKILNAKLKLGFSIVGIELSEEWGPLIKLAYFCHKDRLRAFLDSFSIDVDYS